MAASATSQPWRPYEGAHMECPLTRFLPKSADSALETVWAVRWKLLWPLHRRLWCSRWTIGETLFLPILVGLVVVTAMNSKDAGRSGGPAAFAGGLTFATAARNSVFTLVLGLPFERALFYHKVFGTLALVLSLFHGYVAISYPSLDDRRRLDGPSASASTAVPISDWNWQDISAKDENVSGIILTGAMAAVCLVAFYLIRRRLFEVFIRGHVLFSLICVFFALVHGAGAMVLGSLFWGLDTFLFIVTAFFGAHGARSAEATVVRLPAGVIKISFPRGSFKYCGGQYCFLCVKALGPQFHPFSFSSSPHEDVVTIHVRVLGNWTKSLYDHVAKHEEAAGGEQPVKLAIYIDGPYGAPAVDLNSSRYKTFVMVSGGIGITPMQSIFGELLHQHARGRDLKKVLFMWSVADKFMLGSIGADVAKWSAREQRLLKHAALPYNPKLVGKANLPHSFQPALDPDDVAARARQAAGAGGEVVLVGASGGEAGEAAGSQASKLECTAEFFLTRVRDASEFASANIDPATQRSLVLGKRPDFDSKMAEVASQAAAAGEPRVAVLVCGPVSMVDAVRSACGKASTSKVTLDFHSELFEF